jgi:hypothetical protein
MSTVVAIDDVAGAMIWKACFAVTGQVSGIR